MAKKTQRRPSRNERDQAGCISGLISIFDFRQGRSTRKLLADKRWMNKQVNGASGHLNIQPIESRHADNCDSFEDAEDDEVPTSDIARTSVKKLMEEEMITDSDPTLEKDNSKSGNRSKKNNRRKNRAGNKSTTDMDVAELDDAGRDQTKTHSNALDLLKLMEDLVKDDQIKVRTKRGSNGDLEMLSNKALTVVEDRLVSAVKLILEQRMSKKKHFGEEKEEESSEFIDALEMLSLNKGSFLKLLQDPNSTLVRHIEHLEDVPLGKDGQVPSSLSGSNLPEECANLIKPDESRIKHRNFFRRRSKALGNYPLVETVKDCQSPNRIVVLKPGPAGSDSPEINTAAKNNSSRFSDVDSKVLITRYASQFSFTEIKRRLKHAMGKDKSPENSTNKLAKSKFSPKHQSSNHAERSNLGWSSPNRNHFYTERFTLFSTSSRKDEQVGKMKEKGSVNASETSQYPRVVGSNIYIEAKKHLSEILTNGDENVESVSRQLPKPLGRILSLPNYNNSSPCCSPRKWVGEVSITTPTRLSPRGLVKNDISAVLQENHGNHPSPSRDSLEITPCIVGENLDDDVHSMTANVEVQETDDQDCSVVIRSSAEDVKVHEVEGLSSVVAEIEETTESKMQDEEKVVSISCVSSDCSIDSGIVNRDAIEEYNEESALICSEESSQCLKLDSSEKDQRVDSPTMPDYAHEKIERPSPISILEPSFTDDEISPQSVAPQPVEKDIEPLHIHFEEQSPPDEQLICTRISLEDEESAFEYVEAVLLGSGLNWDEFLLRWLSYHEILDSLLFDEVESFSGQPRHDQKLLFDCANEALKEICRSYFGCFNGIPCLKQTKNQHVIPRGMDLINEVWNRVETCVTSNPEPLSLDQLIKRDLKTGPTKWMDLQSDVELIGTEMEDTIFDELVEDIVLSFEAIRFDFAENSI